MGRREGANDVQVQPGWACKAQARRVSSSSSADRHMMTAVVAHVQHPAILPDQVLALDARQGATDLGHLVQRDLTTFGGGSTVG